MPDRSDTSPFAPPPGGRRNVSGARYRELDVARGGGHDRCWVCEHPESTREDRLQYVRGLLDQHCWIVVGVHEERYRPAYSYTVGLTDHGLPELVITGFPKQRVADLLTRAASDVLNGAALAPGKRIRAADGMAVEVVQVAEDTATI
jgi:hypothetical protein